MNLNDTPARPFAEGFIRIATTTDPESGRVIFNGSMEVLARYHQPRVPELLAAPRLGKHPISESLLANKANKEVEKIVEIPVRLFFNKASNALGSAYVAYDMDGKPACRGNGTLAKRESLTEQNHRLMVDTPCHGPELCEFANSGQASCRRQVRMTVQIPGQSDPLSVFEVRSSSFNGFNTLKGQLELVERRFGGLRHVPLKLQLWQTSNQASELEPFDVFKLTLDATSELEAMKLAQRARQDEKEAGLDADIDAIYAGDTSSIPDEDFAQVADFYANAAPLARRPGAEALAAQVMAKGSARGNDLAGQVIAKAMHAAAEVPDRAQSCNIVNGC